MNIPQCKQSLDIGLGRPIIYLQTHSWRPHIDALEYACLHNTAIDPQCEGSRADYIYAAIQLTDDIPHFASIVTDGLLKVHEHWDTQHIFHLARLFAQHGDSKAREAMYEKARRHDSQEPFEGTEEIVVLDGINGLLFDAEQMGQWLEENSERWVDDQLLFVAEKYWGKGAEAAARNAALTNAAIRRYFDAVDEWSRPKARTSPDYPSFSYGELRRRIMEPDQSVPLVGYLVRWGKRASDEALREAARDLLNERDKTIITAYLRIFGPRAFPLDHQPLLDFARTADEDIADASARALRHISHESVRALALELVHRPHAAPDALALLVRNYAPGDNQIIQQALKDQSDPDDIHWACHAAVDVFKANPAADALPSLLQIYENCPCSICRNDAIQILMDRRTIPDWMLDESRHDSYEDTRTAALAYAQ